MFSGHRQDVNMIAFLLTAFVVGFVIVYIVPKVNSFAATVPGASTVINNKFAQLLIVGAIVLLGLSIFMAIARKVE